MPKICPLFSGSKANCTYISSSNSAILVDIGASFRAFNEEMSSKNFDINGIKAILITHEHVDHIGGLKTFIKQKNIPVIASKNTINSLMCKGIIPKDYDVISADNNGIIVDDIEIKRFATSHDCIGSSGFTFTFETGEKTAVCTDTGVLSESMINELMGCNSILLESNHDVSMLKNGPYPPQLKMRILSDKGHLSNGACSVALKSLLKNGTTRFILGHLSQNNNTPLLALSSAKNALLEIGAKENIDYIISAAKPLKNGVTTF